MTTTRWGRGAEPGRSGCRSPGLEVRLVDDHGEDVPTRTTRARSWCGGRTCSPATGAGPTPRRAVLRDGWLRTGDVAVRDEDGYLSLVDRKKDLIIVSGFNVYPKEVEEAIESHPRVEEAAVVGMPDRADRRGRAGLGRSRRGRYRRAGTC